MVEKSLGRLRNLQLPVLLVGLVLSALLLAGLYLFSEVGSRVTELFQRAGPFGVRVCLCRSDSTVTLANRFGDEIAGSLFAPGSNAGDSLPSVLLLHGNTPRGRKLPVYRVLGARLADEGFTVLSIDFGGFGDSDDPFRDESRRGFSFGADIRAGIRFLTGYGQDGEDGVYLLGHSMGAAPALRVAVEDTAVSAVAVIGPPRRVTERLNTRRDRDYFWDRAVATHRRVYGHSFPDWFTREVWLERELARDMSHLLPALSGPEHLPVLLLDGGLEAEADREYLRRFASEMSCPKSYVTLPESDHYLNTFGYRGVILYDAEVVERTVDTVGRFLRHGSADCGKGKASPLVEQEDPVVG